MELPLYRIVINMDDIDTGMTAVSLVEHPAIEVPFLCFNAEHQTFRADDDKHIITGPAILADTPIYRRSPQRGEYQVLFEKDTIRQIVEKYSKQGLVNNVNLQHDSLTFVNSAIMIESMIIDKERGVCPNEFNDLPDGSWIVSYKITDDALWNEIKNGNHLNGFSIEIMSEIELIEMKSNKQEYSMNRFFKLAKALLKLAEIKTDKDTLVIEGELEVGKAVFVETEEGPVEAADGEYTAEDGTVIIVEAGVITEIKPVEVAPEENTEELEEEETPAEEETPNAEVEELKKKIEELEAVIAEKDAEIETLKGQIAEQEEKLKMSVETPLKKTSVKQKTIKDKAREYFN